MEWYTHFEVFLFAMLCACNSIVLLFLAEWHVISHIKPLKPIVLCLVQNMTEKIDQIKINWV